MLHHRPVLRIATYHYVRDLPRTRFSKIKGMLLDDFRAQVDELCNAYEMTRLDTALAFLKGAYAPAQDLCLLTFDDGLKEHFTEVTPILAEKGIQGIFHVITGCMDGTRVAPVHMNHFLMASLDFEAYRDLFLFELNKNGDRPEPLANCAIAKRTYPLDSPEVAEFKYLFNFLLDPGVRDRAVKNLFETYIGEEQDFASDLYVNWEEARAMQDAGMLIGGHTDTHRPLASLSESELDHDTRRCWNSLQAKLSRQEIWPFCYPYGRRNSYTDQAARNLRDTGFHCAFTTECNLNLPGVDLFAINRTDCNQAWPSDSQRNQARAAAAL